MLIYVELFLLRIEDPALLDHLAEAAVHEPDTALDALYLLRASRRVELLSNPQLLARDDLPARVEVGRKVSTAPGTAQTFSWRVTPRMELDELEFALEMRLPGSDAPIAWSGKAPLDTQLLTFAPGPELLAVVSAKLVTDDTPLPVIKEDQLEREQRLAPLLEQRHKSRRRVDSLLEL